MDLTKAKVLPAAPLPGGGDPKFAGPPAGGLVGIVNPAAQLTLPPPAEGIAAVVEDNLPVGVLVVCAPPAVGGGRGFGFPAAGTRSSPHPKILN